MRIDDVLNSRLDLIENGKVKEAMAYSLLAGGKRIRPVLLYTAVKGYGLDESIADPFACAIEMIHTYSLIHDDLPAMDNDDLRRGRPTCHKQFDEATAILAGDGLLTYAFETALSSGAQPLQVVKAAKILAEMAGPNGMVLGQDLDINEIQGITDWEALQKIHHLKTGCLLSAPLMIAAVLASHDEDVEKWHEIGNILGLAFQIQDDILDIRLSPEEFGKSNSDIRNDKVTSVSLLGENEAECMMNTLYEKGRELIGNLDHFQSEEMIGLIDRIQTRKK